MSVLPKLLLATDEQHLALADVANLPGFTPGAHPGAPPDPHLLLTAGVGEGYAWPVWAPDGRRALVSRGRRAPDGAPEIDLYLVDTRSTGTPSLVFSNESGHREPIAPGVMHYVSWAPDGSRALVAGRGQGGLALSLLTLPPLPPEDDAPVAPDGNAPVAPDNPVAPDGNAPVAPDNPVAPDGNAPAAPDNPVAPDGNASAAPGNDAPDDSPPRPPRPPDVPDQPVPPRRLIDGAPMFSAWSPDSRMLAVHAGSELVRIDTDTNEEPRRILRDQPRFRAPAWSADGSALYYAAPGAEGKDLLWRSRHDGSDRDIVTKLPGLTALVAAPGANHLALLTLGSGVLAGHDLRILDTADGSERLVEHGQVGGAVWAPDGLSLYYITRAGVETDFALTGYDLASGEHRGLARFRPSPAFSAYLAFFDQYAQSHHLVSADGAWITVGGTVSGNGGSARRPFGTYHGCYVMPTDGSAPARRLAAGDIGFFPPA